ncbi:MAG TPA: tetratricopeptide repeat protein [Polyangiales bacterium]|nr:tetratricopeptide repeat protein [Polyangiales bacterium]
MPSRADAQSQTTETAQDWFQRGVSLSKAAQWTEARAAFLRSLEIEPRVSTYFNLATTTLKLQLGRATLLALDEFVERADQREHAEFIAEAARMRAEALDLTGTVLLTGLLADTTVEVDREERRWPTGLTHRLSLDPGHHVLTLRAPSHLPSSLPVEVTRGVTTQLTPTWTEDVPKPAPPWHAQQEESGLPRAWLWAGVAAVSVGALAVVLALTLGADSSQKTPASGGSLDMVFE